MTTLKEQRMVNAHKLGRRDYQDGKPEAVPVYLTDADERDAYRAGYRGELRRRTVPLSADPVEREEQIDTLARTELPKRSRK